MDQSSLVPLFNSTSVISKRINVSTMMECEEILSPELNISTLPRGDSESLMNPPFPSWDVLLFLRIDNVYKTIPPHKIANMVRHYHPNDATCSSALSRIKTRMTKSGFCKEWISKISLPRDIYRNIRSMKKKRLRSGFLDSQSTKPESYPGAYENVYINERSADASRCTDEIGIKDRSLYNSCIQNSTECSSPVNHSGTNTTRKTIRWVNHMEGIPEMFLQAYHIVSRRKLLSGEQASVSHVYAALNLLTGLKPSILLSKNTQINQKTLRVHAGTFKMFWARVTQCHSQDQKKATLNLTEATTKVNALDFDRPFLVPAPSIIRAFNWLQQVLFHGRSRLPTDVKAWARRALQSTFAPFCKTLVQSIHCDKNEPITNAEFRNPDHRINKVLYIYTVKMNYFDGFSVDQVAKYINLVGNFDGIKLPFTPLVHHMVHHIRISKS